MAARLAHAADDTSTVVLRTAWRLIEERGVASVTLAEIAAAAKVSRQAVYLHFGSRAGLLIEMVRHRDSTSTTISQMARAALDAHSRAGFERFLRLWFRYVPAILPVARAIEAAASHDEDAGAAWQDRMEAQRGLIRGIVDRLAESGVLASSWTREEATDWFWSRTHIAVWSQLVLDRKWRPERIVEQTAQSLWSDLVRGNQAS